MDETSFEYDLSHLAETSQRFPARRLEPVAAKPATDVSYLSSAPGVEFGRHAWDEGGHL